MMTWAHNATSRSCDRDTQHEVDLPRAAEACLQGVTSAYYALVQRHSSDIRPRRTFSIKDMLLVNVMMIAMGEEHQFHDA